MANNKKADTKLSVTAQQNEAVVGSPAEYAGYVNFGTRRQDANPFLSSAGEIIAAKLTGTITAEQQLAMKAEMGRSFDLQRKEGVEIITYGNANRAIEVATTKALKKAAIDLTAQAKSAAPVIDGLLRNSIMWRTQEEDGGFNVW